MPDIKGFAACWGISVIHCPYCHGYEFRGQKTGIMANGERAFHIASLVNNLTDELRILTSGKADFNDEQIIKLQKNNIKIIEKEIAEISHEHGHIKQVIFNDGSKQSFDAVYAAVPFIQHSDIPVALGCELTEQGHIKVDMLYKTSIANVFAGGDNTSPMRSVANAVAAGNMIGAVVNSEMTQERF
ncbi:MAG: NAD(P)/FAD-dependent oxidoreductase, partial [Pedobacter sp.]